MKEYIDDLFLDIMQSFTKFEKCVTGKHNLVRQVIYYYTGMGKSMEHSVDVLYSFK